MNCPACGQPLNPTARFCRSCGATIAAPATDGSPADRTSPASPAAPAAPVETVDKTLALNPAQGYAPPAQSYPAPQQYQPQAYTPPAQSYPPPQQQYAQQQYGPTGQSPIVQPGGFPAYAAPGNPIPVTNGRIPAIMMLLGAIALVVGLFLPLFVIRGTAFSVVALLTEVPNTATSGDADANIGIGLIASFVGAAVLALVFSGLALLRRRNLWGALSLVISLYVVGLSGLLWLGAEVSEESYGLAIPLLFCGSLTLMLSSIVFLFRKKVPA